MELVRQWADLVVYEGVLYRKTHVPGSTEKVLQLLLPQALQTEVLTALHDDHGHQGVDRTVSLVRQRCYWPFMRKDVDRWCRECRRCVVAKATQPKLRTFMGSLLASSPLEIVAIDFSILEKSSDGKENLLVVTDVFSKFAQAYPTADQKSSTVARVLTEQWFYTYGVPLRIHTDQGRNFEGELFQQLCRVEFVNLALAHIIQKAMDNVSDLIAHCMTCFVHYLLKRRDGGRTIYHRFCLLITPQSISLRGFLRMN